MSLTIEPIAHIKTPFKEKFVIPRQPGLAPAAEGKVLFEPQYNDPNIIRGIEQFTHLWLIFQFHQTTQQGWSPLVRPPRLGGNEKLGVLATRSTFRPNNLGLSVVTLKEWDFNQGQLSLTVCGTDLMDGTPIFDIKPYIPYADIIADSQGGFANQAPQASMDTEFSPEARQHLVEAETCHPNLSTLIKQVLAQDPRPAFHKSKPSDRIYGTQLYDYELRWQVQGNKNLVVSLMPVKEK